MVIITIVYRIVNLVGSVTNHLKPGGYHWAPTQQFHLVSYLDKCWLKSIESQPVTVISLRLQSLRFMSHFYVVRRPWNKYRIAWRNWTDLDLLRCVSTNDFTRLPQMNPRSHASAWNALCRPWWFPANQGVSQVPCDQTWPNPQPTTAFQVQTPCSSLGTAAMRLTLSCWCEQFRNLQASNGLTLLLPQSTEAEFTCIVRQQYGVNKGVNMSKHVRYCRWFVYV